MLRREGAPLSRVSECAAVVAYVTESEFIDQRRIKDVNFGNDTLLAVVDGVRTARRTRYTSPLVIREEERLVVDDGPAQRAPELVLMKRGSRPSGGIGEEVVRIQFVVA